LWIVDCGLSVDLLIECRLLRSALNQQSAIDQQSAIPNQQKSAIGNANPHSTIRRSAIRIRHSAIDRDTIHELFNAAL
jgi:hypothetical protein